MIFRIKQNGIKEQVKTVINKKVYNKIIKYAVLRIVELEIGFLLGRYFGFHLIMVKIN